MTGRDEVERLGEPVHPTVFIQEELDARGWSLSDLANRMGPECCVRNKLALDLYFAVGPTHANCRIGNDTAERLGRAFDVPGQLFLSLEASWLRALARLREPGGEP